MKRLLLLALALGLGALTAPAAPTAADLAKSFAAPPPSAKPWVYWFWSDGNISREGITADLEAMKRVGIGGVLIMEVDQGVPKGPARFMGPQWRELFKFMLQEAARLGIEVNMNNDAGWCGSGGPWNTPEHAMQKVVWTETGLAGPRRFEGPLPQPAAVAGYYKDIAVLAFPSPEGEGIAMASSILKVTTSAPKAVVSRMIDGNPATSTTLPKPTRAKPQWVQFEFVKPFAASRLSLSVALARNQYATCQVQVSADGRAFKTIQTVRAIGTSAAFNFERVESKFFRLNFNGMDTASKTLRIAEIELSSAYRIDNFANKSGLGAAAIAPNSPVLAPGQVIAQDKVLDLTAKLDKDGRLAWDVPEGAWTVLRLGHTPTGKDNHPAPLEGRGLECDKLSKEAAEGQFNGLMGALLKDSGADCVKTLISTHIDSWEVGCQNWTPRFREEFKARRGYDLMPFLPTFTGRVVNGAEASERFLWDVRRTISEMLNDNYAGTMRELAHKHGMQLSIEAYSGGPFDNLSYSGCADVPMGEFWTGNDTYNMNGSVKVMTSGGHIYGRPVIGAEAFTASNTNGRQKNHPYSIKSLGDSAFCEGINRFVFHRYSMQPWVKPERAPGMTMGPWGLEYERSATWWEQSTAWHEYLARCQYVLQQGQFNADLLYLENEEGFTPVVARSKLTPEPPEGYDFDMCPPEIVLHDASVKDGRIVLKSGMSYRVLILPPTQLMTPALLAKIKTLVEAGATVVGAPQLKSPTLMNFPQCDDEVKRLAGELWGDCDGKTVTRHALGKGSVNWGKPLEAVLAELKVGPDFAAQSKAEETPLRFIHRTVGDAEVYFVANMGAALDAVCSFRVEGRRPELWYGDTGRIEPVAVYEAEGGRVRLPIHFDPSGSVFVVFRAVAEPARVTSVALDGKAALATAWDKAAPKRSAAAPENNRNVTGTFTMTAWVKPEAEIALPREAKSGPSGTGYAQNSVVYPAPGHEVYAAPGQVYATEHSCAGFSVGTNGVAIYEHGDSLYAPVLVAALAIHDRTHIAVVYQDGTPTLFVNGKQVRQGLKTGKTVHPALGVQHTRGVAAFKGRREALRQFGEALGAEALAKLIAESVKAEAAAQAVAASPVRIVRAAEGELSVSTEKGGALEVRTADGKTVRVEIPAPPRPIALKGSWTVTFAPGWGAPEGPFAFEKLISWSDSKIDGIKYFSGTATYHKLFEMTNSAIRNPQSAISLDLGNVQVIAHVTLNGQDLGILWKAPYRVEVGGALKAGTNELEVQVVNLWVNRLIGDEQLPDDCEWVVNRGWVLKAYPAWFLEGKPSPTGRFTFKTWKHYTKESPLLESGLIGPVTLNAETVVKVSVR